MSVVADEKWNWYQRSAALEMAFSLESVRVMTPWIPKVVSSGNINFRQALMKGCLQNTPEKIPSNLIEFFKRQLLIYKISNYSISHKA